MTMSPPATTYRGRLAPSPTGLLHLGHARTFDVAHRRAREAGGNLVLRMDDLDRDRVRPEFAAACIEDLRWLGLDWDEGPDVGGPFAPYCQSGRMESYRAAFERLRDAGRLYPCRCSRNDILSALAAPHAGGEEPVYPGTCRHRTGGEVGEGARVAWRFRVPDGRRVTFEDRIAGPQAFRAGVDFGDFVVWRPDDLPSYQLACAVDDVEMGITEVVRGADLLPITARQILLIEALGAEVPAYAHCPLVTDDAGRRLAKREDAVGLRTLRERGLRPEDVLNGPENPLADRGIARNVAPRSAVRATAASAE